MLRTDVSGDPGFIDLLRRVRATALGAYAHQDLPFERLVDLVGADRSLSHNPLFQVLLAYQNNDIRDIELPGLRVTAQEVLLPVAKVDLELSLAEDADSRRDLRHPELQHRPVRPGERGAHRRPPGDAAAGRRGRPDPAGPPTGDPLPRAARTAPHRLERHRPARVRLSTVPALFAERAAAFADRPAVVSDRVTVDYATLADRANRLARLLIERGVGPEDRVALVLPRSIDLTTALLAVMTVGAAYVPVDPNHPADRIDYMVRDSDPALVVTVSELTGRLPRQVADPLVLDSPALVDALAGLSGAEVTDAERRVPLSADHPAYVIYTSGSTGRPKGVVVPHRGLGSLAAWQARWLGVGAESRVGQFAAPSFDAAAWETVMALLNGAALVLTPADGPVLGEALTDFLRTEGITHATLTPTALSGAEPQAAPPGLTLVTAGEACPRDLAARWSPGRRVINAYGPTETTVCATASGPVDGTVTPPIGGPIANTRVYVLDAGMNPCPVGVPGELYVAGVGLARGYLGLAGTDRRAVRRRPVRRAGLPALPHRRRGAPTRRRTAGVRRPPGQPGEAARLPHRTRRDRVCAVGLRRRGRRSGRRPRGPARSAAAGGLPGARRRGGLRGRGGARPGGRAAAGVHGAAGVRRGGRPAADGEREAGPRGTARARAHHRRRRDQGAGDGGRGDPRRGVPRGPRAARGGRRGQLLRTRRRQHRLHQAGRPGAQGRTGHHPPGRVRAQVGRRPRGGRPHRRRAAPRGPGRRHRRGAPHADDPLAARTRRPYGAVPPVGAAAGARTGRRGVADRRRPYRARPPRRAAAAADGHRRPVVLRGPAARRGGRRRLRHTGRRRRCGPREDAGRDRHARRAGGLPPVADGRRDAAGRVVRR
ncbi:AMP-binding protein [Streptomyces radiopugnans]|nr:AMP-binding protein [Streptomyces radiopugnans]